VRTDRLDWRHEVRLESVLPAMTVLEGFDSQGHVLTARDWSLAVMVHPADLARQELTAEGERSATCHLQHPLFQAEWLEKGVILRGRARAWFLPAGINRAVMAACFAEFAAADPPLGT
jgi:hypothetical protein